MGEPLAAAANTGIDGHDVGSSWDHHDHSGVTNLAGEPASASASNEERPVVTWEPRVAKVIRDRLRAADAAPATATEDSSPLLAAASTSRNNGDDGRKEPPQGDDGGSCRRPFLVALVGIPGSGKTTSASMLSALLEKGTDSALDTTTELDSRIVASPAGRQVKEDGGRPIRNMVMPMDGYHHPRSTLRTFDDPEDALYRRGAPDTFDSEACRATLGRIRHGGDDDDGEERQRVYIPGFDHAKGDPEPDAHVFVRGEHEVVICEGLYLLHDADGWEGTAELFDLRVYVEADVDDCVERLKVRNRCIPGYSPEEIDARCDAVDRVNAYTVERSRKYADLVVRSATCLNG